MSKDIVIQESGVAQTLNTIRRVVTSGQKSGSVDWVPEDETQLGEITIKANGDYTASEKGVYAFAKVTVNAAGKAVGKDDDGNYKVIGVDGNGYLTEHGLPVRIEVVTPPDKTSYITLEPINTAGMVVKAYYDDDSEYGTVPRGEIKIDPIVAPSEPSGGPSVGGDLDISPLPKPFAFTEKQSFYVDGMLYEMSRQCRWTSFKNQQEGYGGAIVYAASEPFTITTHYPATTSTKYANSATINNKTVYWYGSVGAISDFEILNNYTGTSDPTLSIMQNVAWMMIYGDISEGGQEVAVKWPRVGDGQELTSSFEITVSSPIPSGVTGVTSGGGGSGGGSW